MRLDAEDEGPGSTVNDIIQDRHGFLWFATREGLFRYDGYRFTPYKANPEDPRALSDRPYALAEDRNGMIWVGTFRGGVCRLDPRTGLFTVYKRNNENPRSLGQDRIYDILEDSKGRIWVATYGGGLNRYVPETDDWEIYRTASHPGEAADKGALASNRIRCLAEGPDGSIWIGTFRSGLDRLDPETGRFTHYEQGKSGLSYNTILSLHVTGDGVLWVGTQRGLNRYLPETDSFLRFLADETQPDTLSNGEIRSLHGDRDGALWIGTAFGLNLLRPDADGFITYEHDERDLNSLSGNHISALFEDEGGVIWVGTRGKGINKYIPSGNRWQHFRPAENNRESNSIKSMLQTADGTLWIGLFDGGLLGFRTDGLKAVYRNEPNNPQSLSEDTVNAMVVDDSGRIWLGTNESLDLFDPTEGTFQHYRNDPENPNTPISNEIRALLLDGAGNLWVGGNTGLDRLDLQTGNFQHFPPTPGREGALGYGNISALLQDDRDRIWVGTSRGGLYIYDPVSGLFQARGHDRADVNSLPDNRIEALHRDAAGRIWVGTDRGLALYREATDDFERLGSKDGLEGLKILAILHDSDDNLWFSTDKGISRYNLEREHCDNYRFRDDHRYNEFNQGAAVRGNDGRLYFGGINGYHVFDPRFTEENSAPKVVLTDFLLLNKSVAVTTEENPTPLNRPIYETYDLELGPKDTIFAFEFAVLDYAKPKANSFAYRMEGFNDDWIYTDARNRFATYTKLDPGNYIFRVKGANREGIWNHEGVALKIHIKPPFWRTKWFYVLDVLLFLGLMAAIFAAQRNHLRRKKEEELRELELKRQADEALREMELKRKTDELEFARQVQLSMLPGHDINGDHVEVVGRMITASEVGGDYFDFLDLPEGRGCIACGDATGHGMTAGLIVGMTKSCLITLVENTACGPADLIQHLNLSLKKSITQRSIGMALAVSVWDPETRELVLSSAGMPFPLHFRKAAGEIEQIRLKCPPLGFLRSLPVSEERRTLASGDVVIWLSDGFGERCNHEGAYWSQTSLRKEITGICRTRESALDVADAILEACDRFARGRDPEDDMTVVVMRVK
ncbi:MAG: two-component regulator propeller domain-containing protein [Acidobacteriota bacterium]|nr:two-component regulator propeller domain-containing protein [Acidobacteriota bacterium]